MIGQLESLVATYAAEAEEHGRATEVGDHKRANVAHDGLIRALHALDMVNPGRSALVQLLEHANPYVRGWTATHLLRTHTERAVAILEQLADGSGLAALDASVVLQQWRTGRLSIP